MFKGPWLVVLRGGLYYITTQFHMNIMFSTFGTLMICVDFRVPFDLIISRNSAQRIGPSFVYGPVDSRWGVHRWAWHWSFNFWKAPTWQPALLLPVSLCCSIRFLSSISSSASRVFPAFECDHSFVWHCLVLLPVWISNWKEGPRACYWDTGKR